MSLESVRNLLKNDLESIDRFIISQLESHIPLIQQIIKYVLTCGGKRVRPMVLLLSAQTGQAPENKHINIAAVIELIHTATLLHDDVVDNSTLRRGHQTAHTIWGNEASVLVGDFLYTRAFQVMVGLQHQPILEVFTEATHYVAEGEIMQLANCNNPDTTEEFYFEIIHRKTAKLFELAAQLGGILSTNSDQQIIALKNYGLHLGLAYQLIDDALDYNQSMEQTGKNVGQDLAEGKMTLPLIYAMSKSKGADLNLLRKAVETGSSHNLQNILEIIESTDAIKYTSTTAKNHVQQAKLALSQVALSPYRQALEDLSEFVVNRTY